MCALLSLVQAPCRRSAGFLSTPPGVPDAAAAGMCLMQLLLGCDQVYKAACVLNSDRHAGKDASRGS